MRTNRTPLLCGDGSHREAFDKSAASGKSPANRFPALQFAGSFFNCSDHALDHAVFGR
jgi:hypothetical protein